MIKAVYCTLAMVHHTGSLESELYSGQNFYPHELNMKEEGFGFIGGALTS